MGKNCRYFLDGKQYNEEEIRDRLKALPIERMAKFVPKTKPLFLKMEDAQKRAPLKFKSKGATLADRLIQQLAKENKNITTEDKAAIQRIAREDPNQLPDAIRAIAKPTRTTKLLDLWKAGLLSGFTTPLTKALSDSVVQVTRIPEMALAGLIDRARSAYTGKPRERFEGEAIAAAMGLKDALPDALREFRATLGWKDRFDPKEGIRQVSANTGIAGKYTRLVFNNIGAFDRAADVIATRKNLAANAYRIARTEGHAGEALWRRVNEITSAPEKVKGLVEKVAAESATERFVAPLEGLTKKFDNLAQAHPGLQLVVPFRKVPANIFKEAYTRTPVHLIKVLNDIRTGKLQGGDISDALAKPLMGTLIMGAAAMIALEGGATGGGPTDKKKKAALLDTGWQPYSFKIGNRYVSYHRAEPVSSLLGAASDFVELLKEGDHLSAGEVLEKGLTSLEANFTGKTYLAGLEGFFGSIRDPRQFAAQYIKQLEGSLVPNIVGKAAVALDPTVRQTGAFDTTYGVPQAILAKIPGASRLLDARHTAVGEEAVRGGSALERFASPAISTEERTGPLYDLEREMARLDMVPPQPRRTVTYKGAKIELTSDEYQQLVDATVSASQRAARLISQSGFQRLPDTADESPENNKQKALRNYFDHFIGPVRASIAAKAYRRTQRAHA